MTGWSTMIASCGHMGRFRLWWVQSCNDKDDYQQENHNSRFSVFLLADLAGSFVLQVCGRSLFEGRDIHSCFLD